MNRKGARIGPTEIRGKGPSRSALRFRPRHDVEGTHPTPATRELRPHRPSLCALIPRRWMSRNRRVDLRWPSVRSVSAAESTLATLRRANKIASSRLLTQVRSITKEDLETHSKSRYDEFWIVNYSQVGKGGLPPPLNVQDCLRKKEPGLNHPSRPERFF